MPDVLTHLSRFTIAWIEWTIYTVIILREASITNSVPLWWESVQIFASMAAFVLGKIGARLVSISGSQLAIDWRTTRNWFFSHELPIPVINQSFHSNLDQNLIKFGSEFYADKCYYQKCGLTLNEMKTSKSVFVAISRMLLIPVYVIDWKLNSQIITTWKVTLVISIGL